MYVIKRNPEIRTGRIMRLLVPLDYHIVEYLQIFYAVQLIYQITDTETRPVISGTNLQQFEIYIMCSGVSGCSEAYFNQFLNFMFTLS